MYAEAFGLREEPFAPTPDPAYLVLTPDHREALAALEYGLRQRRGFISLIGEVGTGKTTLLYTLLRRISADVDTAFFAHTTLGFEDLLWAMLRDLGLEPRSASKRDLIASLDAHLHKQADAGRITALIIDEAQNLSVETLEELRLLSNFETFRHKLLQIVLVGQPELEATLAQPRVRQLRDRIAVRATLRPLPNALVAEYVEHRLAVGGFEGRTLFRSDAIDEITRVSRGVPRRINALCHGALLNAYARREPQVGRAAVREAARELAFDADDAPQDAALRARRARVLPLASARRYAAVAAALAAMIVIASGAGAGLLSAERVQPAKVALASSGCAPTAPRMTNPPRRDGDRLVEERGLDLGELATVAADSFADFIDWVIPSEGYEQWQRMHRRPAGAWSNDQGRG